MNPTNSNCAKQSKNPRLVFVNRFFAPDMAASSQMLSDVAFHLAQSGYEIAVVSGRVDYSRHHQELLTTEVINGVNVHRVWSTGLGNNTSLGRMLDYVTYCLFALLKLLHLLQRGDLLIVKTDPPMMSVLCLPVARFKGARLVNWLQDIFPEVAAATDFKFAKGWSGAVLRRLRNRTLESSQCNIAIGELMREYLVREGIPEASIRVLPNHADERAIVPVAHVDNPLRQQRGLSKKFVIAYSGNLGFAREYETILAAAEKLKDNKDIVFLFIGGGTHTVSLKERAGHIGLRNLLFKPYVERDQLQFSLGLGDIHLVTLKPAFEGLIVPSKIDGIAAAGRPAMNVGMKGGEVDNLLTRWHAGLRFEPGRVDDFVENIKAWQTHPEKVAELGLNARKGFVAEFGCEQANRRWIELLDSLAVCPRATENRALLDAHSVVS